MHLWTEDADARLATLWRQWQAAVPVRSAGLFDATVAPQFGRRFGAIRTHRLRLGLKVNKDKIGQAAEALTDGYESRRQTDAKASNADFLTALARASVKAAPEPAVRPEPAFRQLPPPTLIGQAFS